MHQPGITVEFAWKKNLGFVVRCTPDPEPFGGFHKAKAKQRKESRSGKKLETHTQQIGKCNQVRGWLKNPQ